ncbi:MAG: hypothetical protein V1789_00835 [PVC group bacterium]
MKSKKFCVFIFTLFLCGLGGGYPVLAPAQQKVGEEAGSARVKQYLSSGAPVRQVLSPEGEFIAVFNDEVAGWVKQGLARPLLQKISDALEPSLEITLNKRGFAPAAIRAGEGGKDDTNYNAIWVRDNVWVYYSFLENPARKADAERLLLALWDYYATAPQIERFRRVIADPALSLDQMAMPHVRFDGSSPDLGDVMVDGKPQVWNHRQIDAHGIFFTALGEALAGGRIGEDQLTAGRLEVLSLYPLFLNRIKFFDYEDAGAWEELPRKNTSSIGLATRSLQVWRDLLCRDPSAAAKPFKDKFTALLKKADKEVADQWTEAALNELIGSGLKTVKRQLMLGGESPDYPPEDIHFRLADSALIFLIQPSPLQGLSEEEMRKALLIVEGLIRPCGTLRYERDSYQSGNYWIKPPAGEEKDMPALTGDTSSKNDFLWRLSRLIPDTEAQWFFDSLLALARLHLAEITGDPELRRQDIFQATVHLKRALGQITGAGITADGRTGTAGVPPESINTVVIDGNKFWLPSPIVPLNWARAGLSMALSKYVSVVE